MKVAIQPVNEGPLDFNRKAGDIVFCYLDTGTQPGNQEKKSWLIVEFPDPTNHVGSPYPPSYLDQLKDDFEAAEYSAGPTPESNEIRRARKYSIPNFRQHFSPDELVAIDSAAAVLADGETSQGGTVVSGVVSGLFTFDDIVRK